MKMMVGEHDWFLDLGDKWQELFGPPSYSFDWKGVHCVVLMSVHERDFWTARKMTPAERMHTVAGLDNGTQSRFEVGDAGRNWLKSDLAKVAHDTPLIVFSHSPLYKYYRDWNFWTEDADEVQAILRPYKQVTVLHGHTHQMLSNRIGNIDFHGFLSTAWPWPYAPQGLPPLTIQMNRADPFDQFDGCGDGRVNVARRRARREDLQLVGSQPGQHQAQLPRVQRRQGQAVGDDARKLLRSGDDENDTSGWPRARSCSARRRSRSPTRSSSTTCRRRSTAAPSSRCATARRRSRSTAR